MATKKCGKCAGCKKGSMCTKEWSDSRADKAQDKKAMTGMNPMQKKAFVRADKVMDAKKPTKKQDTRMDASLAKKVKRTVRGK
jgi:hypothetical protein